VVYCGDDVRADAPVNEVALARTLRVSLAPRLLTPRKVNEVRDVGAAA